MNPAVLAAIAGNAVRELVRSKLLYNLLVFAALLIAGSLFIAQLTVGDFARVIVDMGLGAIELVGVLIAVVIGVSVVAGEVERKTIYPTLARPVSRGEFLFGRYLGLLAILVLDVVVMTALLAAVLGLSGFGMLSRTALLASGLIAVELAVVAALAVLFSSFSTPILAAAFSFAFTLIGHMLSDVRAYGTRSKSGVAKSLTSALYRGLPDLELFNLKTHAADNLPVPPGFVLNALAYGLLYAALLLLAATLIFRSRDLK